MGCFLRLLLLLLRLFSKVSVSYEDMQVLACLAFIIATLPWGTRCLLTFTSGGGGRCSTTVTEEYFLIRYCSLF